MTKKRCPYCAEKIQAEAKKCRFCSEFLPEVGGSADGDSAPEPETQKEPCDPKKSVEAEMRWERNEQSAFSVGSLLLIIQGLILASSLYLDGIQLRLIKKAFSGHTEDAVAALCEGIGGGMWAIGAMVFGVWLSRRGKPGLLIVAVVMFLALFVIW